MQYRIITFHDTIGNDDIYLSDSITNQISDTTVDTISELETLLHSIISEGKVNSLEVIFPNGKGNYHLPIYHPSHPFADVESSFEDIPALINDLRNGKFLYPYPTPPAGYPDPDLDPESMDLPF